MMYLIVTLYNLIFNNGCILTTGLQNSRKVNDWLLLAAKSWFQPTAPQWRTIRRISFEIRKKTLIGITASAESCPQSPIST